MSNKLPNLEQAYSIDVECVASGFGHLAREVAHIALVDSAERIVVNLHVLPEQPIVSCLTAITGLTWETLQSRGRPLSQALEVLRRALPPQAVLIGQGIQQDVQWLKLREGTDFQFWEVLPESLEELSPCSLRTIIHVVQSMIDLAGLYRVWNDHYKTWSVWSQDYLCSHVLGWDVRNQSHDAAIDAVKSMRLYKKWLKLQADDVAWQNTQATLLAGKAQPSFAKRNPVFDGVCMGHRKNCVCGDPFYT